MTTHSDENVELREPDFADDLPAIVRFHGANDVLDAVLDVAGEVYGEDRAVEKVHELVIRRAQVRTPPGTPT